MPRMIRKYNRKLNVGYDHKILLDVKQMAEYYDEGWSIEDIASLMDVSPSTISSYIPSKRKTIKPDVYSDENREKVLDMHNNGMSCNDISNALGIDVGVVKKLLQQAERFPIFRKALADLQTAKYYTRSTTMWHPDVEQDEQDEQKKEDIRMSAVKASYFEFTGDTCAYRVNIDDNTIIVDGPDGHTMVLRVDDIQTFISELSEMAKITEMLKERFNNLQ